jgi:acetate kinase
MHITTAEEILNKQSGWKALTGTTDFGVISDKALREGDAEHEMCRLALDIFVDRILGFVGSYFVKLDGEVDALVFAGGIGERGAILRKRVIDGVKCLGFELDDQKNDNPGEGVVSEIGYEGDRRTGKKILVVKTDEQLEMAKGVAREFMK